MSRTPAHKTRTSTVVSSCITLLVISHIQAQSSYATRLRPRWYGHQLTIDGASIFDAVDFSIPWADISSRCDNLSIFAMGTISSRSHASAKGTSYLNACSTQSYLHPGPTPDLLAARASIYAQCRVILFLVQHQIFSLSPSITCSTQSHSYLGSILDILAIVSRLPSGLTPDGSNGSVFFLRVTSVHSILAEVVVQLTLPPLLAERMASGKSDLGNKR